MPFSIFKFINSPSGDVDLSIEDIAVHPQQNKLLSKGRNAVHSKIVIENKKGIFIKIVYHY